MLVPIQHDLRAVSVRTMPSAGAASDADAVDACSIPIRGASCGTGSGSIELDTSDAVVDSAAFWIGAIIRRAGNSRAPEWYARSEPPTATTARTTWKRRRDVQVDRSELNVHAVAAVAMPGAGSCTSVRVPSLSDNRPVAVRSAAMQAEEIEPLRRAPVHMEFRRVACARTL